MEKLLPMACMLIALNAVAHADEQKPILRHTIHITATVLPHCRIEERPPILTKTHYVLSSLKTCNSGKPPEVIEKRIPLAQAKNGATVGMVIAAD